jgi:hypothetical protein
MSRAPRHTRSSRPDTSSSCLFESGDLFIAKLQSSLAVLEHRFELLILSREIGVVRHFARLLSTRLFA